MEADIITNPGIDWKAVASALNRDGFASLGWVLGRADCMALIAGYQDVAAYRKTIDMARHGFGSGLYRYFAYPLPDRVQALREDLYPPLAMVANEWAQRLGEDPRYPPTLAEFQEDCAQAGQTRPTPLILRYGPGDYNCLHQDLYGAIVFPIQVVILLSDAESDFSGGEFVLTEQRPRRQSRAHVVPLSQGEAVAFAVNDRPVKGKRGEYRVKQRHGVSTVRAGCRYALGIIFHEAA